jgi:hypothetical protein
VTRWGAGGGGDRRRQHLPRRGGRLGRHGPRHRRLHGHAGHRDERAGPGRCHGQAGPDGPRDVRHRHRAGGRALCAPQGAAVPRRGQGGGVRRRHRQPSSPPTRPLRCAVPKSAPSGAQGHQGGWRVHRRPEEGSFGHALRQAVFRRGHLRNLGIMDATALRCAATRSCRSACSPSSSPAHSSAW